MNKIQTRSCWLALFVVPLLFASCAIHHHTAAVGNNKPTQKLVGEFSRGWLKYQFYLQEEKTERQNRQGEQVVFSIRIVNMADGTSPLRKLSGNLDQYNTYYEYLLNETKNDLTLQYGTETLYPVYYAFENNYNAFPFETINVGYAPPKKLLKGSTAFLQYADKVFAHDTINCPLTTSVY